MVDRSYDWILVGLALDLMGGLALAKGFISKRVIEAYREAQPRLGVNSFYVKSAIVQKAEAVVGGTLLAVGFCLQMWGNFHGGPAANSLGWINSGPKLALLFAVAAAVGALSLKVAHVWARRRFQIYFCRTWTPDAPPLNHTGDELDALGYLFDLPRRSGESDESYRGRLEADRAVTGAKYAGRDRDFSETR